VILFQRRMLGAEATGKFEIHDVVTSADPPSAFTLFPLPANLLLADPQADLVRPQIDPVSGVKVVYVSESSPTVHSIRFFRRKNPATTDAEVVDSFSDRPDFENFPNNIVFVKEDRRDIKIAILQ